MIRATKALTRPIYHYTCLDHGAPGIARDGYLRPGLDGLVWMTDLDEPHREALGLTMHVTRCDRTARRFEVASVQAVAWTEVRREMAPAYVRALELAPGVMPRHWYISRSPVQVIAA